MKTIFIFSDCCDDVEIQFCRRTELEFVPSEGMRFMFAPEPFELFVDTVTWRHDEGALVVSFNDTLHENKEDLIESVRTIIGQDGWEYQANKKGSEIIQMILEQSRLTEKFEICQPL